MRNLGLCVICALLIENRFGRCVIVQNEMNRTPAFLRRERFKREDVDVLIGESLAQLSKRSRLVFLADCELLIVFDEFAQAVLSRTDEFAERLRISDKMSKTFSCDRYSRQPVFTRQQPASPSGR